jgi:hypothetical protein
MKNEYIICEVTSAPILVTVTSKETKVRNLSLKQLGDQYLLKKEIIRLTKF